MSQYEEQIGDLTMEIRSYSCSA